MRFRPLPVRSTVRLRRPADIWHKPAFSAAVALAIPDFTLFALGRLDLVLYTSAGAMCALYAHHLPYAARARTLVWVVLGMVASLGVALTAASLVTSAAVLVVLAALVAAVHKMLCDATRIGPPGNLILTFISASAFFVPQRLGQVPFHLSLALGTGVLAWLVGMAPALVRPRGPESLATARALEAAAGLLRTLPEAENGAGNGAANGPADQAAVPGAAPPDATSPSRSGPARHATAAAVNAAWHTLFLVPARTDAQVTARVRLERLLVRAESALAVRAVGEDERAEAGRYLAWAHGLRRGRPLPEVALSPEETDELAGITAERDALRDGLHDPERDGRRSSRQGARMGAAHDGRAGVHGWPMRRPAPDRPRGVRAVFARLAPGSPLLPIVARVAVGCVLAGWVSMAVGVGHPYWAVVTAASIYQANTTLSWQRALQRTIGNFLGLLIFTALLPLIHTGHLAMILLALAFQVGAEACISRNYWLGSVWVTPMALLLTEFGNHLPAHTLVLDRWVDTVVGAAVGLACCVLVTNRRAGHRIEAALARVTATEAAARAWLDGGDRAMAAKLPDVRLPDPVHERRQGHGTDETGASPDANDANRTYDANSYETKLHETGSCDTYDAHEAGWARDRLAAGLVELREAVEVASGEWWQGALPEERVARAEQRGHQTLSRLVRRLSEPALAA
ncbi:FUSC family protein [Streptomyces sp. NPDC003077]|uniref:FUSC family protein n=1 Tax=Streptomyces sp. NPDC003077 TaxID=3154443 RepID=UPI0033BEEE39